MLDEKEKSSEDDKAKEGRMVISAEAEEAINEFKEKVNNSYFAGKANRYDAASFMLLWFKENATEDAINRLRRRLADSFSMLDALKRQYKAEGQLPAELQAALDRHFFGDAAKDSKKAKNSLKQMYISDIHEESKTA